MSQKFALPPLYDLKSEAVSNTKFDAALDARTLVHNNH